MSVQDVGGRTERCQEGARDRRRTSTRQEKRHSAFGIRHSGIAKINHRLLSAAADSSVEELILALQADEFVVLLVGEFALHSPTSISSLVPRFACEYQDKSSIPERESAGDGLELGDGCGGEQRIEAGKIHCLFTVIHCS
jgi:hypothetical protein